MKQYQLTYNGQTQSMIAWCRKLKISRSFFSKYIKEGLSVDRIVEKHDAAVQRISEPIPGVDETMCWTCCRDGRTCPWMKNETPVEGWDATPTVKTFFNSRTGQPDSYDSFMIHACPLYKKEESEWQESKTQSEE